MKIAVIGAGVIGVSTAHVLNQAGCTVHVFEKNNSVASDATFANSGLLNPVTVQPFFKPSFIHDCIKSVCNVPKSLKLSVGLSFHAHVLMLKTLLNTRKKRFKQHSTELSDLANHSRDIFNRYIDIDVLHFEQGFGCLNLFRQIQKTQTNTKNTQSPEQQQALDTQTNTWNHEQLNAFDSALSLEKSNISGGLYDASLSYGNCALFSKKLKALHAFGKKNHASLGVSDNKIVYHMGSKVLALRAPKSQGSKWMLKTVKHASLANNLDEFSPTFQAGVLAYEIYEGFDAVVVCAGVESDRLLKQQGIYAPVLACHAYGITAPFLKPKDNCKPRAAIIDGSDTVITPIGSRIRVMGQFELTMTNVFSLRKLGLNALNRSRFARNSYAFLEHALKTLYPSIHASMHTRHLSTTLNHYTVSSTLVSVDSKPIIGKTKLPGLYVNIAHGPHQFALAFASAQLVANQVMSVNSEIDGTPFLLSRFK